MHRPSPGVTHHAGTSGEKSVYAGKLRKSDIESIIKLLCYVKLVLFMFQINIPLPRKKSSGFLAFFVPEVYIMIRKD